MLVSLLISMFMLVQNVLLEHMGAVVIMIQLVLAKKLLVLILQILLYLSIMELISSPTLVPSMLLEAVTLQMSHSLENVVLFVFGHASSISTVLMRLLIGLYLLYLSLLLNQLHLVLVLLTPSNGEKEIFVTLKLFSVNLLP